jgi:hypothetical protein
LDLLLTKARPLPGAGVSVYPARQATPHLAGTLVTVAGSSLRQFVNKPDRASVRVLSGAYDKINHSRITVPGAIAWAGINAGGPRKKPRERVMIMTFVNTRESANQPTPAELEAEDCGEFVALRRTDGEQAADNIRTLLQRVAGTSAQEIDKVIGEMLSLRKALENQSARIQSDITAYAHFSQSAMQSTRIIAESLARCGVDADVNKPGSHDDAAPLGFGEQDLCRATTGLRPDGCAASPARQESFQSTEPPGRTRRSSTR